MAPPYPRPARSNRSVAMLRGPMSTLQAPSCTSSALLGGAKRAQRAAVAEEGLRRVHYDLPRGSGVLGEEQLVVRLPDWSVVTSGAWLEGDTFPLVWGTTDACLVQVGDIRLGQSAPEVRRLCRLCSYGANKLWNTNLRPSNP